MARAATSNKVSINQAVAGSAFSNPVNLDSARDARVYVKVADLVGNLDIEVQISPDNVTFFVARVFNTILANGNYVEAFEEHQLAKYMKLRYIGTATITEAVVEHKDGI